MLGKPWLFLAGFLLPATAVAQAGGEVILPEGTRISIQLNDYLSTKLNSEGDTFTATVTTAVYVKDRIVIPKGSIIYGSVSRLLRPGRFKGKAMMNLLFSSVRLPGALEPLPIVASLARIGDEGSSQPNAEGTISTGSSKGKDAAKVAVPALTGAGIGAIVNGGRGAAIGAGIGAAVGILAGRGTDLELKRGCAMEIVLDRPLTLPGELVKRNELKYE